MLEIYQCGGPRRLFRGLAFDPKTTALKMFFSSSTTSRKKKGLLTDFKRGWTNEKVQSAAVNGH